MSMTREEIDTREKIAVEIETLIRGHRPITGSAEEQTSIDALWRAIGVVRKPLWHGQTCPCSLCKRFDIVTCSNTCSSTRKLLPSELERLDNFLAHNAGTVFYCGHCRGGQNEWFSDEMLFDTENEFAITPCCHTEATEALKCYCINGSCKADD